MPLLCCCKDTRKCLFSGRCKGTWKFLFSVVVVKTHGYAFSVVVLEIIYGSAFWNTGDRIVSSLLSFWRYDSAFSNGVSAFFLMFQNMALLSKIMARVCIFSDILLKSWLCFLKHCKCLFCCCSRNMALLLKQCNFVSSASKTVKSVSLNLFLYWGKGSVFSPPLLKLGTLYNRRSSAVVLKISICFCFLKQWHCCPLVPETV